MFNNYFKIAWRIFFKQKALSFINLFGLSVGIACFCLFIFYAVNEFSFDNFHKNRDNIYRVYHWSEEIGTSKSGEPYGPMPLGPAMQQELPDIENYCRFLDNWGSSFIRADNNIFSEKVSYADTSFFKLFSFKLLYGNASNALQDLHSIVLTKATAEKLFGNANAIGKTIEIKVKDKFQPFTITAIAENFPSNSSLQFTVLSNFGFFQNTEPGHKGINNWNQISYQTFLQLKPGSKLAGNKKLLAEFRSKYYPDDKKEARKDGYGLQHLTDIHTDPSLDGGVVASIDPNKIWFLLMIASGILLIACINFTTLSIGRSAKRAKEVCTRKVIGANRKSLTFQFLAESLLLTIVSATLGLVLAKLLLPYFNQLSGRELQFSFTQFPQITPLLIGLVLVVSLLAGSCPAIVLSGFKPLEVLKAKVKLKGSNLFTRSLITLQFVLSVVLIIATITIIEQLHFMESKNPGFNKENVIVLDVRGISNTKNTYALFKQKFSVNPEIIGIASADNGLGKDEGSMRSAFKYNGKDKEQYEYFIDPDYLKVLDMKLLAGRNFDPAIASDTITSVIINEAMMHGFGWSLQNAVGQKLQGYYENPERQAQTPMVIGVVQNFNFLDFSQDVQPQMFQQFTFNTPHHFFIRIKPGDPSKALVSLQTAWKDIAPEYPLKYNFLDENLNKFYESEKRWSNIIGWSGGISICLACLGLLGLVTLAVANRTKEIGVRKVLGASVFNLLSLISKEFLRIVVIAFIIAAPIAWYIMNSWLLDYAYHITINFWTFLFIGVAIIILALLVISIQSIKTALANPVKSLRVE